MVGRTGLLILTAVLCAAPLHPQESSTLQPGVRIRVSTAPQDFRPNWQIGTFHSLADTMLVLRAEHQQLDIPVFLISRIETSQGTRSQFWTGLGIGAAAGALAGAVILLGAHSDEPSGDFSRGDVLFIGAAAGGALGGVVGGIVGLTLRTDRWVPLSTPIPGSNMRIRVSIAPARR